VHCVDEFKELLIRRASLFFSLYLKVKKLWEEISTAVKKNERTARQNEIKRLKVTGNGHLSGDQVMSVVSHSMSFLPGSSH